MVQLGLHIVLYTQSDYIVNELNNLLLLSYSFPERDRLLSKYKYRTDELIRPEQIRGYRLQSEELVEIPLSDQGIEMPAIEKVITDMNQRSDAIYYAYTQSLPVK
ncbi:MAG: hypothetical protein HC880_11830 [Bacteroidia bacterium]|nr:hypothetical protein [Bacteroidia bacterium]